MRRKLTSIMLMTALLVGGASTFVSCKDYDGDMAAVTNASVKGLSDKLAQQIENLQNLKAELARDYATKPEVQAVDRKIDQAISDLTALINDKADASDVAAIAADVAAVQADIVAINTNLETLNACCTKIKTVLGENLENVILKGELADYAAGEYADDFLKAMMTSLNAAIAQAGTKNFTDVLSLFAYLDKTIPAELKNLSDSCAMLAGRDSLLNSRIDSLVTGVNVDMVSNHIYGTLNTPFGVKNYVLAGFVGGEIASKTFADEEVKGLAYSANGGNVYLTINPAEVDVTGWNIGKLVGRDGKYAPGYGDLILGPDNTPVTTVTKASNGLGGYVATPEIEDPKAAKININKDELKDVAKNVLGKLKGEEGLDVTKAVHTVYNTFANAIDQYYAVKCQVKVQDVIDKTKYKTSTIVSDYNIAAVTIQPLAYTTNIGVVGEKVNIPQIPLLQDVLGAYISDVKFDPINTEKLAKVKVTIPDINKVTLAMKQGSTSVGTCTWDETTSKGVISMDFTAIEVKENGKTEIEVELKELVSVVNQLNGELQDVNKLIDKVDEAAGKVDRYINKVNSLIGKVNKFIDNANQYLQPIMVASTEDNAFRLSEIEDAPSVFKANGDNKIILKPTSYTLELLAPAYKKSVKVNEKELNEGLDGSVKAIPATLKVGTNKIEYSAMDFYGNVVNKTYYVNVVK